MGGDGEAGLARLHQHCQQATPNISHYQFTVSRAAWALGLFSVMSPTEGGLFYWGCQMDDNSCQLCTKKLAQRSNGKD